jgi:hypothetical protein
LENEQHFHPLPWFGPEVSADLVYGRRRLALDGALEPADMDFTNIDHLFDQGFISCQDDGRIRVSPLIDAAQIARLGISTAPPLNVGAFSSRQPTYRAFHRESAFLHGR